MTLRPSASAGLNPARGLYVPHHEDELSGVALHRIRHPLLGGARLPEPGLCHYIRRVPERSYALLTLLWEAARSRSRFNDIYECFVNQYRYSLCYCRIGIIYYVKKSHCNVVDLVFIIKYLYLIKFY